MVGNSESSTEGPVAAVNSRDMEKFLSFYTDDCVYEDLAVGKVNRGKDELRSFYSDSFRMAPDLKFEEKITFTSGDWAAAEWVMTGTHSGSTPEMPATGKRFSVRGASVMQIRDGKISRESDYWNMASLLQQVGILPAGTSPNWFGKLMMRLTMKH